jgi:WD40 repeat protein
VWDADSGELVARVHHGSGVNWASFSPDGRRVITGGDDNRARVWDARTGEPCTPWLRHNGGVNGAAFSPDGLLVLTASSDNTARLWRLDANTCPLRAPTQPLLAQAAARPPSRWPSPDGRRVAVAEGDRAVRVCDAATGEPVGPPLRHSSPITHAAFSPDDARVVTTSDDNTARVWQADTGELLAPPLWHRGTVQVAAFSPDGRLVVTAGADQTARVWDAATGQPLTPPLPYTGPARSASFSADSRRAEVTGAGSTVWAWDLRRDDRPVADLMELARLLSGSRIDPARGLLPLEPEELEKEWQRVRSGGNALGPVVPPE